MRYSIYQTANNRYYYVYNGSVLLVSGIFFSIQSLIDSLGQRPLHVHEYMEKEDVLIAECDNLNQLINTHPELFI